MAGPSGLVERLVRVRELSTGRRWAHRPERAVARSLIVGSASRSLVAGGGPRAVRSFLGPVFFPFFPFFPVFFCMCSFFSFGSLLVARLGSARGGGARDP
ncbi:hypothetical protein GCM10010104_07740 [Streptomyces indiaensis]|uniref:Uncharacterized protein n=1 Tax=Streptomyces indiaensis TaxID=284033 RepID=A0ABN3D5I3_9ACTN